MLKNRDGEFIAKLQAMTKVLDSSLIASAPGRTDGTLKFGNLGRSNNASMAGKIY